MFTVVIAADSEEEQLARTLAALVPAVAEGVVRDAVVIDTGGLPGIAAVASAAGCRHVAGSPAQGLAEALAGGRGAWVLMLRPGVMLEVGWFREAAEFVERTEAAGAAATTCAAFSYASLDYRAGGRVREVWRFVAGNLLGAVLAEQALIIAKTSLMRMGPHSLASLPPRKPAGSRLVILRAKAFAP
ncbi:MAG: glycosyl transferase [Alphaproteobacteria bacterium]|nr:MAG: glycosyl transferase [Alphaproteobacteria bacterium]